MKDRLLYFFFIFRIHGKHNGVEWVEYVIRILQNFCGCQKNVANPILPYDLQFI